MLAYSDFEDIESYDKVYNFDPANKLLPAILLIISVLLFRCRFNSKQSQKVVASEKVIIIHVALFLSYVMTYAYRLIIFSYYVKSPQESMEKCRLYLTESYFNLFSIVVNIATLILFIYMSVAFSRPLNGYWREFLLSYRNQTLNQAI